MEPTKKIENKDVTLRDLQVNAAVKQGWILSRLWSAWVWTPSQSWFKCGHYVQWFYAEMVKPLPSASIEFRIGPVSKRV